MFRRAHLALFALLLLMSPGPARSDNPDAVGSTLPAEGHIVLLRHALAPGTGDPANFKLGDCTTQRNLSDAGRRQATEIGRRMRDAGLGNARVYSSGWCRCLETADLLNLGPVEPLPPLNSFFQQPDQRDARLQAIREWIGRHPLDQPVVLVTHQVTITGLTGVIPASGEWVVVRRGKGNRLDVVSTVRTDLPPHPDGP